MIQLSYLGELMSCVEVLVGYTGKYHCKMLCQIAESIFLFLTFPENFKTSNSQKFKTAIDKQCMARRILLNKKVHLFG